MLSPGYITLDAVIERVKRKLGFSEAIDRYEVAEHIWDVTNYLGIVYAFELKTILNIQFYNWRFKIPPDFVDFGSRGGLRDSISGHSLTRSTDIFQKINNAPSNLITSVYEGPNVTNVYTVSPNGLVTTDNQNESTAFVETLRSNMMESQLTYDIQGDHFYFGFEKGCIDMVYNAYPVGDDGMPQVSADAKYIRAVVDYICYVIACRLKLRNLIASDDLERFRVEYYHSAGATKTKAHTPDLDQMEAIRKFSQRLIPKYGEHAFGFRHMGDQEQIR